LNSVGAVFSSYACSVSSAADNWENFKPLLLLLLLVLLLNEFALLIGEFLAMLKVLEGYGFFVAPLNS